MARYLIFGGTGSLGKRLINRLLPDHTVYVCSRDESKHWTIKNELANHPRIDHLKFAVGDVRDQQRVKELINQVEPSIIIIAAALKHVDTCELSPNESVATNLIGTQNIIRAVQDYGMMYNKIEKVLLVSTDKACSPVNVYGMCKAVSERIVTSQASHGTGGTQFLCTRYGNVLESRGSIIPLFRHQAEHNEFLTVTDPDMTRYLMTLDDSVDLINVALECGQSGETWIPKLRSMRIGDLADLFACRWNKQIKIVGLRPGEKKHEDLINESEAVRTRDVGQHYVIGPAYNPGSNSRFSYTSADDVLSPIELEEHLEHLNVFNKPLHSFTGVSIDELITNQVKR